MRNWSPDSWREFPIRQQPVYSNPAELADIEKQLRVSPGLIPLAEILSLKEELKLAEQGQKFLLHAGDCAEQFKSKVQKQEQAILKLASHISQKLGKEVVSLGRIAGQYAKPRTNLMENGEPSFQGDMVNSYSKRQADPRRLITAYESAKSSLEKIEIYTSHEALLLNYEEQLAANNNGIDYSSSAHLLWIGSRTNSYHEAHVEFASGIANPIGIKIDEGMTTEHLLRILDKINSRNESGKVILICRLGLKHIEKKLPDLMQALQDRNLIFSCDPMHGNTHKVEGQKVRYLDEIQKEISIFNQIHSEFYSVPRAVHLEMTHEDILECLEKDNEGQINSTSACDPRLNLKQALQLF